MYGPVRSLQETFAILKITPPQHKLTESASDPDRERIEKKRLIEEARRQRSKTSSMVSEKVVAKTEDKIASKSRLLTLAEEVEALSKDYENVVKGSDAVTSVKEMDGVVKSLNHIIGFSEDAVKKFEWRSDERSKKITKLFGFIKEEAKKMRNKVELGEVTEEDAARKEVNPLIKRFVEAVGIVKDAFKINVEVFNALRESLKNVD